MSTQSQILSFFRDVETMEIPAAPRVAYGAHPVGEYSSLSVRTLPWETRKPGLTRKEATFHLVCLGVTEMKDLVTRVVEAIAPDDPVDEEAIMRLRGQGFLGTLLVDWKGRPVKDGLLPAPFVLGVDRLSNDKDLSKLDEEIAERTEQIVAAQFGKSDPAVDEAEAGMSSALKSALKFDFEVHERVMTQGMLIGISRGLAKRMGLPAERITFRVMSRTVRRRRRRDLSPPDFSETVTPSFFIGDITRVAADKEKLSHVLGAYLGPETGEDARVDLLTNHKAMSRMLRPSALSHGRWLASPEHHLSIAQQAAVGAAIDPQRSLVAVNGPPGTGKTTLLRDVIAHTVTERAKRLCEIEDPKKIFIQSYMKETNLPVVRPNVVKQTGLLVVSNNNAAVENISNELPRRSEIDSESFEGADYLGQVANDVAEAFGAEAPESWGLLALKLGNKANIEASLRGLDEPYKDDPDEKVPPRGLYDRLRAMPGPADWAEAKEAFQAAGKRLAEALAPRLALQGHFIEAEPETPDSETTGELQACPLPQPFHVPDEAFLERSFGDVQKSSAWVTPALERLRSEYFLAALGLHQAALRANLFEIRRMIYPYKRILSGQDKVTKEQLIKVWNTLFFIAPVISTTLASVRRMPLEPEWIGHVLVDEAGQATPQSVVGVLQRAHRATVVGDPLQIEPVFTVPEPVVEKLRLKQGIDRRFSPALASAQTLADGVMTEGAWVEGMGRGGKPVWTGIPLRVHRRCSEPMFSVANDIAYDGQMVQAVAGIPLLGDDPGPSCWHDVRGRSATDKVVPEEIACLEAELMGLRTGWPTRNGTPASVFVISPFVSVAAAAQDVTRKVFGREAFSLCPTGTVHRFQGREADIVYLLLGSAPGAGGEGSRRWASARPNLLNVALTRARARVYVIGSYDDWSRQAYFSRLAQEMHGLGAVLRR